MSELPPLTDTSAPSPTPPTDTPAAPVVVVKSLGPRGITTSELYVFAIVSAVATVIVVATLVFSPSATDRAVLSGYVTKLVGIAATYIVSRGIAKFGQGS